MRIGLVKELTPGEGRAALTPHAVYELTRAGHRVYVELGAGEASGLSDEDYTSAGARVVSSAEKVWADSELVAKVFGPVPEERVYLRKDLIVFAFLSLAINEQTTRALLDSRCVAVSMETIEDERGGLPVLAPMSEIAGRLVPQIGAHYLQRTSGGKGILLGGSVGVRPGRIVILGAGIVGTNAAVVASGLGAEVVVLDRSVQRLRRLEELRLRRVSTLASSSLAIRDAVLRADLVVGAILVVGSKTPHLVDGETVSGMENGSVIVDVDVDHGGCVETSQPTTLLDPTFVRHGVIHYCVKNVPATVSVTATRALSNALLPYIQKVAGRGLVDALNADDGLRRGVAVVDGRVVSSTLARVYAADHYPISSVLPLHAEAR